MDYIPFYTDWDYCHFEFVEHKVSYYMAKYLEIELKVEHPFVTTIVITVTVTIIAKIRSSCSAFQKVLEYYPS